MEVVMSTFTPQMEAYVRQQLRLEREPWWVASELARMAKIEQAVARAFVDERAAEVRPRIAWGYLPTFITGMAALLLGLTLLYFGIMVFAWLLIPVGVALTTSSGYAWRRLRRSTARNELK